VTAAAGALVALLTAGPARAEDAWLGRDKALHFGVSVGLAGGGYGISSLFLEPRWQRAAAGSAFSLSLGAAKELHDLAGRGDASWRDFTWDVAGTAVGIGLGLVLDLLIAPQETRSSTSPTP
jgi:putative lipoprotein